MADAAQFKKVANIIRMDSKRRFIVVSAPGKRFKEDKKITDLLIIAEEMIRNGIDASPVLGIIEERFTGIVTELGLDIDIHKEIKIIRDELPKQNPDYAASRGEYLNGLIMASYLKANYVDPYKHVFFNEAGRLDEKKTYPSMKKALSGKGIYVISGFYGQANDGNVNTFSRGGSDITGSIVARSTESKIYENWTDVSGLLMADPRIVQDPRHMPEVTYLELRELSYMGANVLHEEAIFPVRDMDIPIHIRNTDEPAHPGTRIVGTRKAGNKPIVGVAGHRGFEVFYMNKTYINNEVGFGRRVLSIFESYGINFEHLPSGIDSLSVVVNSKDVEPYREKISEEIVNYLKVDELKIMQGLSLIAVVGVGMAHHIGIAAKLFTSLAEDNINVMLIDQGASELSIIIGVDQKDFQKALNSLYRAITQYDDQS